MSNSHKTHLLPLSNHASTSLLYFHFRQKIPYLEWEKFYLEVFYHYKWEILHYEEVIRSNSNLDISIAIQKNIQNEKYLVSSVENTLV